MCSKGLERHRVFNIGILNEALSPGLEFDC